MVLLALHSNALPFEQNSDFDRFDQRIDENVEDLAPRGVETTNDLFDYGDPIENADLEIAVEDIKENPNSARYYEERIERFDAPTERRRRHHPHHRRG